MRVEGRAFTSSLPTICPAPRSSISTNGDRQDPDGPASLPDGPASGLDPDRPASEPPESSGGALDPFEPLVVKSFEELEPLGGGGAARVRWERAAVALD